MLTPERQGALLIDLDTKNCSLDASEVSKLETMIDPLRGPVEKFPISTLYITIERHPRSQDYYAKTALRLTGRTLTTGHADVHWMPAFENCIGKLVHRLKGYQGEMSGDGARHKYLIGTRQDVEPADSVDPEAVDASVADQDFERFRSLLFPYEESVRKRVGRWVQRYPEIEAQIDVRFQLDDAVEEVFLMAFERYDKRPRDILFGDWLEQLIDPSVKLLRDHTEEELENIQFVRSTREG